MKLSNIILVSLVASISIAIIVGALQLRLTGELKSNYLNKQVDSVQVDPFRHLVISKAWNVTIMHGERPAIVTHSAAGEIRPRIHYHTSGDTLYVDSVRVHPSSRSFWLSIYVPHDLGHIRASDAHFGLMDYSGDRLSVDLNRSRVTMNAVGLSNIGRLLLAGTNGSVFEAYKVAFDTVAIDLRSSRAVISGDINKLHGSMKDGSTLQAPNAADIQIRKDSGSTLGK